MVLHIYALELSSFSLPCQALGIPPRLLPGSSVIAALQFTWEFFMFCECLLS